MSLTLSLKTGNGQTEQHKFSAQRAAKIAAGEGLDGKAVTLTGISGLFQKVAPNLVSGMVKRRTCLATNMRTEVNEIQLEGGRKFCLLGGNNPGEQFTNLLYIALATESTVTIAPAPNKGITDYDVFLNGELCKRFKSDEIINKLLEIKHAEDDLSASVRVIQVGELKSVIQTMQVVNGKSISRSPSLPNRSSRTSSVATISAIVQSTDQSISHRSSSVATIPQNSDRSPSPVPHQPPEKGIVSGGVSPVPSSQPPTPNGSFSKPASTSKASRQTSRTSSNIAQTAVKPEWFKDNMQAYNKLAAMASTPAKFISTITNSLQVKCPRQLLGLRQDLDAAIVLKVVQSLFITPFDIATRNTKFCDKQLSTHDEQQSTTLGKMYTDTVDAHLNLLQTQQYESAPGARINIAISQIMQNPVVTDDNNKEKLKKDLYFAVSQRQDILSKKQEFESLRVTINRTYKYILRYYQQE